MWSATLFSPTNQSSSQFLEEDSVEDRTESKIPKNELEGSNKTVTINIAESQQEETDGSIASEEKVQQTVFDVLQEIGGWELYESEQVSGNVLNSSVQKFVAIQKEQSQSINENSSAKRESPELKFESVESKIDELQKAVLSLQGTQQMILNSPIQQIPDLNKINDSFHACLEALSAVESERREDRERIITLESRCSKIERKYEALVEILKQHFLLYSEHTHKTPNGHFVQKPLKKDTIDLSVFASNT